jgi:hypothetical protein
MFEFEIETLLTSESTAAKAPCCPSFLVYSHYHEENCVKNCAPLGLQTEGLLVLTGTGLKTVLRHLIGKKDTWEKP